LAFSSILAFTAFYLSNNFYFLSSVALSPVAGAVTGVVVGFTNLEGALIPPPIAGFSSLFSIFFASIKAFFSAVSFAYLSISDILLVLFGNTFSTD